MRYIATVHVHLDVEAQTEEQARDIARNQVLGAGFRFALAGPSHAANGVRLDVPLSERDHTNRCGQCGQPLRRCCYTCPSDPHDDMCGF